jgi:hypothetical protein
MDGFRFDALTRSLATAGSRRRALVLAFSGTLAPLLAWEEADAHDALLKCKKLKGERKKKCPKKVKKRIKKHNVPAPAGTTCIRNCSGKICGSDGCNGSCGDCVAPEMCQKGVCTCGGGNEPCKGQCVAECPDGSVRDPEPEFCFCCYLPESGEGVVTDSNCETMCCSRECTATGEGHVCTGLGSDERCTFNEQCDEGLECIPLLGSDGVFECSTLPPLP